MASLVASLQARGALVSERVARVMLALDRGLFMPRGGHGHGVQDYGGEEYEDHPVPIGWGQTISAPHMHATALELLKGHLAPGARALDVGSGSGYLCAAMGLMVAGTRTPGGQRAGAPLTTADADVGTAGSKAYRRATSAPSSSSSSETLASGSAPLASGSAEHCVPVPVPVALQGGERAHGTMAGCPAGPSDPWGTSASQAEEGAGLVIGCDKVPELVEHSKHALHAAVPHLMDDGTISVLHGNALDPDFLDALPVQHWDAIHVGAAADEMPAALVSRLSRGGRMVIPLGPRWGYQSLVVVDRDAHGALHSKPLMSVGYVPLTRPREMEDGYAGPDEPF